MTAHIGATLAQTAASRPRKIAKMAQRELEKLILMRSNGSKSRGKVDGSYKLRLTRLHYYTYTSSSPGEVELGGSPRAVNEEKAACISMKSVVQIEAHGRQCERGQGLHTHR